jgi:hypothetical protein
VEGQRRFGCFHDFLDFLRVECDAVPSRETIEEKLRRVPDVRDCDTYPEGDTRTAFDA